LLPANFGKGFAGNSRNAPLMACTSLGYTDGNKLGEHCLTCAQQLSDHTALNDIYDQPESTRCNCMHYIASATIYRNHGSLCAGHNSNAFYGSGNASYQHPYLL
jgi:hypothetical protein